MSECPISRREFVQGALTAGAALATRPIGHVQATTGAAQWLLLRREVHWAGWWILVSLLAWSAALSLAPDFGSNALPPLVLSGVTVAVVTGVALALLLNFPKPPEEMTAP